MADLPVEEWSGFDPFTAAERAAEEAIELILDEAGQELYEHYIEKKSFSFASEVVSNLLVSEMKMCFVSFDRGEPSAQAAAAAAVSSTSAPTSPRAVPSLSPVHEGTAAASPPAGSDAPVGEALSEADDAPRCGWDLEPEPPRCRVDTWARACVPIRRKLVQPKVGSEQEETAPGRDTRRLAPRKGGSSGKVGSTASQGRPGSRATMMNASNTSITEQESTMKSVPKTMQAIPLHEEREDDEEEAEMREKKEREARRKREEEARMAQKAAQEAEEVARLAQVKDQMKNKPFTYDGSGNVLWIQPPQTQKLPPAHPMPSYTFKTKEGPGHHTHESNPRPARGTLGNKLERGKKDKELVDSFKRFASQQPAMIDAMKLAPGVVLQERGRTKSGQPVDRRGMPMSRQEYEEMVASGSTKVSNMQAPGAPDASPSLVAKLQSDATAPKPTAVGALHAEAHEEHSAPEPAHPSPSTKDKDGTSGKGSEIVPRAPDQPRPIAPVPLPTFRRAQMKRDALGYSLSTRERVNTTTTASRFPGCAAQPPLGATMGHGLASGLQRAGEFYFPGAGPSLGLGAEDSVQGDPEPGTGTSPRPAHGQIVSNPHVAKQVFSAR